MKVTKTQERKCVQLFQERIAKKEKTRKKIPTVDQVFSLYAGGQNLLKGIKNNGLTVKEIMECLAVDATESRRFRARFSTLVTRRIPKVYGIPFGGIKMKSTRECRYGIPSTELEYDKMVSNILTHRDSIYS